MQVALNVDELFKYAAGTHSAKSRAAGQPDDFSGQFLLTSKVRHSSVGWNPVHRIFKHLGGLGPSLRWDDGVIIDPAIKHVKSHT